MAGGNFYSDDERVVLMLIFERHADLTWPEATRVFNTVLNHQIRTEGSLVSAWYARRNGDQQEAWNRLRDDPQTGPGLATRQHWLQVIDTAVEQLGRPSKKPQRPPHAQWSHDMRLVLSLLVQDTSLDPKKRTRVFNALFQNVLAEQGVAPVSRNALSSQWGLRNKKRKEDEESQQAESTKLSVPPHWQRIIYGPHTEEHQADVVKWEEKIKEQKVILGYSPHQASSEKSHQDEGEADVALEEEEEEEEEEGMHVHEPQRNQGEPSVDPSEDVGNWRFGTWYDWNQARHNLGGQVAGMPATPSAEDVQRLRRQLRGDRRADAWTQGINIYPGVEFVDWARVDPDVLYPPQQSGQGQSLPRPARLNNPGDSVPATAMGENGEDTNNGGREAAGKGADHENNIQEGRPEDGSQALEGSSDNVTPVQNRTLLQQEIINNLLRSDYEHVDEVRDLLDQINQTTRTLAFLAARLAQSLEAFQKRDSR
jgi:hypothetical protein